MSHISPLDIIQNSFMLVNESKNLDIFHKNKAQKSRILVHSEAAFRIYNHLKIRYNLTIIHNYHDSIGGYD